jgi:four helix bundle protein
MEGNQYINLYSLQIYQLARELSKKTWIIYNKLDWKNKKIIGDQFIESVDSVGANIAEGYARFHYLDKIKFYYNARASHSEAIAHWLSLLKERKLVSGDEFEEIIKISSELAPKLNSYINAIYRAKNDKK